MSRNFLDGLRLRGASHVVSPLVSMRRAVRPPRRRLSRLIGRAALLVAGVFAAGSALALLTGTWTTNGASSATTTVSGITVAWTGTANQNYANGTFNATNNSWWTDPYGGTVNNGASLVMLHDTGTRTYTVTFSKPVDNPVLHIDRLGGAIDSDPNSSRWTLTSSASQGGSVTMTRLSGNTQFVVQPAQNRFFRQLGAFSGDADAECRTGNANSVARGTACGSVQFNGTGITSLSFSIDLTGPTGGDELEMRWSFDGAKVIVRKQTVGGSGTFGITASDALTQTFNLTTTAANTPVASSTYAITNHAVPITLTEAQVAGYVLTGAACTDQSGVAVSATVNATTRQVVIPAANYRANQTLTCTLTNTRQSTLALAKRWVNAAVNDTAALSATGGTNAASLASTANTAAETDTGTAVAVAAGNVITLAETLGAGNARTYTASAWSCTGGNLSGNTLTLTAAHTGLDIVCTITNTARLTDLSISKTPDAPNAVSGDLRTFTVRVTNTGPEAADGAIVADTPGTGLTCPPAGNPVTCTAGGGAQCPASGALSGLTGSGVAIPTLPSGGTVTFLVPCRVTATGQP
jgi:uncharacterized repeat protein (TIGR01451 family)